MQAIEYPAATERPELMASQVFDVVANIGLKLHTYGALEPYRGKIRQFLEQYANDVAKVPPNPAGNLGLPNFSVLNQKDHHCTCVAPSWTQRDLPGAFWSR